MDDLNPDRFWPTSLVRPAVVIDSGNTTGILLNLDTPGGQVYSLTTVGWQPGDLAKWLVNVVRPRLILCETFALYPRATFLTGDQILPARLNGAAEAAAGLLGCPISFQLAAIMSNYVGISTQNEHTTSCVRHWCHFVLSRLRPDPKGNYHPQWCIGSGPDLNASVLDVDWHRIPISPSPELALDRLKNLAVYRIMSKEV